ncbi:MAG: hypothetical protein KKA07_06875 [Bacteroidetes bacterium]|nr:hypothetical protein [Bacteroidota bacterium]MBU1718781.1 hypothetical protein [Bacteroidota bacterium]
MPRILLSLLYLLPALFCQSQIPAADEEKPVIINGVEDSVLTLIPGIIEEEMPVIWKFSNVCLPDDSVSRKFVLDDRLVSEGWDTLNQPSFWQRVMQLHEDSGYVNIADNRTILEVIEARDYLVLTDEKKKEFKKDIVEKYCLADSVKIFVTSGKQHFYKFRNTFSNIDTSISVFLENGVDPWYAQTILLIESPDKLQKSCAGAYGPFQLMKGVAKKYGLVVTKYKDERADIGLAAVAASKLIKYICVPETERLLVKYKLPYSKEDLWFRLMVLHVYHAGSGNVSAVLDAIQPTVGGPELISKMWQTSAAGFKNASQNYSQVALAALLELHRIVMEECEDMY